MPNGQGCFFFFFFFVGGGGWGGEEAKHLNHQIQQDQGAQHQICIALSLPPNVFHAILGEYIDGIRLNMSSNKTLI